MNRTYNRMKRFIKWPGMTQELEEGIQQCETCKKKKITQNKTKMPIKITSTLNVLEKCSLDIIGPLSQTSDGDRYVNISRQYLEVHVSYTNTATRQCKGG